MRQQQRDRAQVHRRSATPAGERTGDTVAVHCTNWLRGRCAYGRKCRFVHDMAHVRMPSAAGEQKPDVREAVPPLPGKGQGKGKAKGNDSGSVEGPPPRSSKDPGLVEGPPPRSSSGSRAEVEGPPPRSQNVSSSLSEEELRAQADAWAQALARKLQKRAEAEARTQVQAEAQA